MNFQTGGISIGRWDHFEATLFEKMVSADHAVEFSTGRIFDQDNILDNIQHLSCKSSSGITIFKQIALKSKFDISVGTK